VHAAVLRFPLTLFVHVTFNMVSVFFFMPYLVFLSASQIEGLAGWYVGGTAAFFIMLGLVCGVQHAIFAHPGAGWSVSRMPLVSAFTNIYGRRYKERIRRMGELVADLCVSHMASSSVFPGCLAWARAIDGDEVQNEAIARAFPGGATGLRPGGDKCVTGPAENGKTRHSAVLTKVPTFARSRVEPSVGTSDADAPSTNDETLGAINERDGDPGPHAESVWRHAPQRVAPEPATRSPPTPVLERVASAVSTRELELELRCMRLEQELIARRRRDGSGFFSEGCVQQHINTEDQRA